MTRALTPILLALILACASPLEQLREERPEAFLPSAELPADPDYPFTTDGCSHWPDDGWVLCCVEHDLAYWYGGTPEERLAADRALRECVGGVMGCVMYVGVRVGGSPIWRSDHRWGYGWEWPRSGP